MRNLPRLAFVQQVLGTEWARYSAACIRRLFPECELLQVRGAPHPVLLTLAGIARSFRRPAVSSGSPAEAPPERKQPAAAVLPKPHPWEALRPSRYRFDPLRAVLRGLDLRADYLVHVDEDCFLQDREQLWEVVDKMQSDPSTLCAGPSDGGTFFRHDRNPLACNLFFNVFKRVAVKQLMDDCPHWRSLRVSDLPSRLRENLPEKGTPLRPLQFPGPFHLDDFEPYYPLYWLMLREGCRIEFLPVRQTEDDRRCTAIRLAGCDRDLCFHMWHLRDWAAGKNPVIDGIPNNDRFARARCVLTEMGVIRP